MMRRVAVLMGLALLAGAAGGQAVPEPAGYRMEDYRAPVPATLEGAAVLSTDQAHRLWQSGQAAFVDVLPRPPRPKGLPAATLWRPKPRSDIPGSIWLPDTGYGALAPVMQRYFEEGLVKASGNDRAHRLVFYCLADCWMSWNAAKRALVLGYSNVSWYPGGTDEWAAHGFPLEAREPLSRPDAAE
jgi:PQQ-dependent catabolism-associated CXXCW motif protein